MTGIVIPDGGTIGSASDTDALTITNTGVVKASQSIATSTIKDATGTNNSISIATNGEATFAENIILTANKGLSFQNHSVSSATGASSTTSDNVLDDYEEGTWTPTVTSGTISIYSNSAQYIKIGKKVIAHCRIHNFSDRSSASAVNVSNLPFTIGVPDSNVGFAWTDNSIKVLYLYGASVGNTQAQWYAGGSGYGAFRYDQIGDALDSFLILLNYITQ